MEAPAEDEKSIRQKLALLTRKLISEDDEMELLNIYRETQRLRAALDNIQPANPPAAKTASNLQRSTRSRKSSRRPGHPGSNLTKKRESAHSAQGMLSRCLYLPQAGSSLGGDASRESETDTLEDKVNALNAADTSVDAPPPAPTDDDDNNDGGEDLGSLPPPPAEPAPDGEETAQEFFICSAPECGQESYGETDPRDGHFYCNDCWNEYQGITAEAGDGPADDGGGDPTASVHDPSHPDYWQNLKQTMEEGEAKAADGYAQPQDDLFAKTLRDSTSALEKAVATPAQAGAGDDALDEVMDVMLERIQDKRKSIRYQKKKRGFFTKRQKLPAGSAGGKFSKGKKAKKKKVDPAELAKAQEPVGEHGIFVRNPSRAIPLVKLNVAKAKKKKKPAVPPKLFGTESADGTTCQRSVYTYDEDQIVGDAYAEPIADAEAEWVSNGLPIRQPAVAFILTEFGGVNDPNQLAMYDIKTEA